MIKNSEKNVVHIFISSLLAVLILIMSPGCLAAQDEGPSPLYVQLMRQWAKVTAFPENAAEVIIGKLKIDAQQNPKLRNTLSPALIVDLQQFFYELFYSEETMHELAGLYSQYFTLDEMADIIKFYNSPVGQKLTKADAQLRIKTQEIGATLLKKHEREYMKTIAKYIVPKDQQNQIKN